jgi:uncharacterized protein
MQAQPMAQTVEAGSPTGVRGFITRHPILAYLLLAYSIGWACWVPPLLGRGGLGIIPVDLPVPLFIVLSSVLGLAGSAFLVTGIISGRAGMRELRSRTLRWRVGIQWYLLAVFSLPLACILAASLFRGGQPLVALFHNVPFFFSGLVPQVILVAALVNLWEETGWTGFMFARLQARYGALLAAVLVAPAWGGIHLPLFFIAGGLTDGKFPISMFPLLVLELLAAFSIPVRLIAVWLYNNARGSVLMVALLHASLGVVSGTAYTSVFVPGTDLTWVYGVVAILALILVLATRGRLSYHGAPKGGTSAANPQAPSSPLPEAGG